MVANRVPSVMVAISSWSCPPAVGHVHRACESSSPGLNLDILFTTRYSDYIQFHARIDTKVFSEGLGLPFSSQRDELVSLTVNSFFD